MAAGFDNTTRSLVGGHTALVKALEQISERTDKDSVLMPKGAKSTLTQLRLANHHSDPNSGMEAIGQNLLGAELVKAIMSHACAGGFKFPMNPFLTYSMSLVYYGEGHGLLCLRISGACLMNSGCIGQKQSL